MKRNLIMLIALLLTWSGLKAQTWDEWFNQKSTQTKYLLQQIAALQVYIKYTKDGYNIAKKGLKTVGDLSKGEFDIHGDYFESLKLVNPKIRTHPKVSTIMQLQRRIINRYNISRGELLFNDVLSDEEKRSINEVYSRLITDCEKTLDELISVITDHKLEMKDEERIERIDKIHQDMQEKFMFCESFSAENKLLAIARLKEKREVERSRIQQGLNR
ncbi:hypothetical protein [Flavobacterium supellecticarium]|nr:hypothetical protein [Flavobacterium supellecticarium]